MLQGRFFFSSGRSPYTFFGHVALFGQGWQTVATHFFPGKKGNYSIACSPILCCKENDNKISGSLIPNAIFFGSPHNEAKIFLSPSSFFPIFRQPTHLARECGYQTAIQKTSFFPPRYFRLTPFLLFSLFFAEIFRHFWLPNQNRGSSFENWKC